MHKCVQRKNPKKGNLLCKAKYQQSKIHKLCPSCVQRQKKREEGYECMRMKKNHKNKNHKLLRAASPKYRLNQEIAKKWNFFKVAQNEVFRALVTKIIV